MTEQVTRDLLNKCADDVGAALRRTLSIAPEPHLPIAMAAGASVIAVLGAILDTEKKPTPDFECLILAGLLLARTGIGGRDPIGEAYEDFGALKTAGRVPGRTERKPHKVMTPEEYAAMPIMGWHEVCRDVDGFGGVGVRFLTEPRS